MKAVIEYGNVYEKTVKAFKEGHKIIFHKGGTGSGKTFDLSIFTAINQAMRLKDKVCTVVSESYPHLEIGPIRIFESIMKNAGLFDPDRFKAKRIYTFPSGSVLEFFSADRIGKALGARRYLLYGNEINSLKFEVFDELSRRSEVVIGDFNPTAEFWLEKFMDFYGGTVIKSNYKDNPFLPDFEVQRILRRAEIDENFKRIHIDAEYGNYEGLVFPDWLPCDKVPEGARLLGYGLDFGYSNDPTALVAVYKHKSEHILHEIIYRTGLLTGDIISLFRQSQVSTRVPIYADNSDPRLIKEISNAGYNCKGLKKEKVMIGVELCKKYLKYITKSSVNLIKEKRNYSYIQKDGKYINEPADIFNHAIDAERYAIIGIYGRAKLTMF